MFSLQLLQQGAAREDRLGEFRRWHIARAVARIRDKIAGVLERGGIAQLEPVFHSDSAGTEVGYLPAILETRAPGVPRYPFHPERIQHGIDIEVETVAHDRRHPAVPVSPIEQLDESGPRCDRTCREAFHFFQGRIDCRQRRGIELLHCQPPHVVLGFELTPLGFRESFEHEARGVLQHNRVIEIQAEDIRHGSSLAYLILWPMELSRARYLASLRGREAMRGLPDSLPVADPVRLATELRRSFPPEEASALAEQLTLRARALRNQKTTRDWLYTAHGLEMVTHPVVAAHRAARMVGWEVPAIDLTAGIGGDLSALVEAGLTAFGVEREAVHAIFAAANSGAPIARGDAACAPFDLTRFGILIDPSRREGSTRRFNPAAFSPPWDVALALAAASPAAVVKAPPGIGAEYVPPVAELEAVQLGGSMRETTLWFGEGARPGFRQATLLPAGATLNSTDPEASPVPGAPAAFLFDPESCVTRATLVTHLANRLGAHLLDSHIAYLCASQPAFSPLAATFEVLDTLAFSISRLKDRLRKGNWRPDEIRRRAFPVEPDEIRKLLGRLEGEPVTLLFTTIASRRTVFIARRLFAPA